MACPQPFKDEDCDNITRQLQVVHDFLELAAKCERCGFMVDGYRSQLQNIQETLSKVKAEFFPGRN